MPIDPAAKLAKFKKTRRTLMSQLVEGELVTCAAPSENLEPTSSSINPQKSRRLTRAQSQAIAEIVLDNKFVLAQSVRVAREKLQARAGDYVDKHMAAVDLALASGDADVARKGAWEAIEKISARTADGQVERIVDAAESNGPSGPRIQIGIALGGLPAPGVALVKR